MNSVCYCVSCAHWKVLWVRSLMKITLCISGPMGIALNLFFGMSDKMSADTKLAAVIFIRTTYIVHTRCVWNRIERNWRRNKDVSDCLIYENNSWISIAAVVAAMTAQQRHEVDEKGKEKRKTCDSVACAFQCWRCQPFSEASSQPVICWIARNVRVQSNLMIISQCAFNS